MRDNFGAHYSPDESAFEKLWEQGLIALDTNVLLNLYRYPATARDELLLTLERFRDRLFVPHQVAVEYHRMRLAVIASQYRRFHEVQEVLTKAETALREGLRRLQLERRHSSIPAGPFLQQIESDFANFRELLQKGESSHLQIGGTDPIRERLDSILAGRIGSPFTQSELDRLYAEGKQRYNDKRPPGYADLSKSQSDEPVYYASNLRIEKKFGDLIIWKQIVRVAADRNQKHVIFVTDDEKDDWWEIVHAGSRKVVGARPELKDEIAAEAGVALFQLYSSERFLERASRGLERAPSPEAIGQIGDIRRADQEVRRTTPRAVPSTVLAVGQWLRGAYGGSAVDETVFPRFIVRTVEGLLGYEVRSLSHNLSRVRSIMASMQEKRSEFLLLSLVLVTLGADESVAFKNVFRKFPESVGLCLVWGHLNEDGRGKRFVLDFESSSDDSDSGGMDEEVDADLCLRCREHPIVAGGQYCDYCQQIWDHLD